MIKTFTKTLAMLLDSSSRFAMRDGSRWSALLLLLAVLATSRGGIAQTVQVDATHVVNTFTPLYALGSTVDRVPSNATNTFFRPDQIKQIQAAGWGVISYRQNTD